MILKQHNNKYILINDVLTSDEEQFIQTNEGFLQVNYLPYSISDIYVMDPSITQDPQNPIFISSEPDDIIELKKQKMQETSDKFNDLLNYGHFVSSLGFEVDNRRGLGKDDKDNVSSLIVLNQEPVYYKDYDNNFHPLTIQDLTTLKQEMIQDGLGKYQWKWNKETEIMNCTTLQGLENVMV